MPTPARDTRPGQAGFALVEVMISAMIAILVTGAVVGLLVSTGHSAAQERNRSQAFALAQEDQARLRTMRIPELNLNQKREVTVGGATYTVHSTGVFVENKTGASTSCESNTAADYVRISSEVTWPPYSSTGQMEGRQPVLIQSIVSPLSGSLNPSSGTLEVKVIDASGEPITGAGLNGSGPGNFSGSTDSNGCAAFDNLPEGNYTLTPSLPNPNFVDLNGKPPGQQEAGVKAQTTELVTLQFGEAGSATVKFETHPYGGGLVAAKASSIVATHVGENTFSAQAIPSLTGEPESSITARLFPFSTPVAIYAGYCEANEPELAEYPSEFANVTVPAGGEVGPATIQLPPLNLTVTDSNGKTLTAAEVVATDTHCEVNRRNVAYRFTTNSSGRLDEPGLPYGTYEVCASASISGHQRYETKTVEVHSLNPTFTTISLPSNHHSGSCST